MITRFKAEAVVQLRELEDLPLGIVASFESDASIPEASLRVLESEQRTRVDAILTSYQSAVRSVGLAGTAVTGIGTVGVIFTYIVALPFFIVGLLLTVKKRVWRCQACGYIFDRA